MQKRVTFVMPSCMGSERATIRVAKDFLDLCDFILDAEHRKGFLTGG